MFLHEKTVPSRRGHHYGGTWPGFTPSSTGARETEIALAGIRTPVACTTGELFNKELSGELSNNYSEHLHMAPPVHVLLKTCTAGFTRTSTSRQLNNNYS